MMTEQNLGIKLKRIISLLKSLKTKFSPPAFPVKLQYGAAWFNNAVKHLW